MEEENRFVEKSYSLFSQTVEYFLPLSHLSTKTAGLLCSAVGPVSLFKGVYPDTFFLLQQFADISIADLAIPASMVA